LFSQAEIIFCGDQHNDTDAAHKAELILNPERFLSPSNHPEHHSNCIANTPATA